VKSYDFDAVAYDAAVYCVLCLPPGVDLENEGVHPIFADAEVDAYPTCDVCGTLHDYVSLTEEGRRQHLGCMTAEEAKAFFQPYAWPGGYTVLFYVIAPKESYAASCGDTYCSGCARKEHYAYGTTFGASTYDEGPPTYCEECNTVLYSSYGDPDCEECKGEIQWIVEGPVWLPPVTPDGPARVNLAECGQCTEAGAQRISQDTSKGDLA